MHPCIGHSNRRWFRPLVVECLEGRVTPGFLGPLAYNVGTAPVAVAVGDLNGDGAPDLVVANEGTSPNYTDGSVSVLLGNGDGSFQPAQSLSAGIGAMSAVIGDFNGDGIPDLAIANGARSGGFVRVLLGNGDGSFQPAHDYMAGYAPSFVAVGDFNGDGIADLAVINSSTVGILLGNGDGTFQTLRNITTSGFGPTMVVAADVNGDGILDLVTASIGGGNVSVFLGNGDATFQPAHNIPVGNEPDGVAVGDVNGDGIPDLAVANYGSRTISVLLGNGDGTLQYDGGFSTGSFPTSVAIGDINGDGFGDIAIANVDNNVDNYVSVALSNGDGSFQPVRYLPAGDKPSAVAVGDVNGDGALDLIVANTASKEVSVLLGNGDDSFQTAPGVLPEYEVSDAIVAVGDFNGDNIPDLAVSDYISYFPGVIMLLGNGDGTFRPAHGFSAGKFESLAVGDVNGDGIPDLVGTDGASPNGTVGVLLGNGDGSFQPARSFSVGSVPVPVALADVNGDGHLDLVVVNEDSDTVSVLLGNGDGTFQPARNFATPHFPFSLVVGDVNGDGIPDLITGNGSNVSVLLGNGDGSFQTARDLLAGSAAAMALEDMNGDGIPDLVVTDPFASVHQGTVSVLLGNGDDSFQPARTFPAGDDPVSLAVADVNGDGVPDLVVANGHSNDVTVLLGNGDGTFQTMPFSYLVGLHPTSMAVGDFNGDGFPDLAVAYSGSSYTSNLTAGVSILFNDGNWPSGPRAEARLGGCQNLGRTRNAHRPVPALPASATASRNLFPLPTPFELSPTPTFLTPSPVSFPSPEAIDSVLASPSRMTAIFAPSDDGQLTLQTDTPPNAGDRQEIIELPGRMLGEPQIDCSWDRLGFRFESASGLTEFRPKWHHLTKWVIPL